MLRLYIILLMSLILFSCEEAGYFAIDSQLECHESAECGLSLVCVANRCVDEATQPLGLALRVTPADAPGSTFTKRSVFVPSTGVEDIHMPAHVEASVSVFYQGEAIEGYADLSQNGGISSLNYTQTVALGSADSHLDSRKSVLPGVYTISVYPNNKVRKQVLPTVVFHNVSIDAAQRSVQLKIGDALEGERMVVLRGGIELQGAAQKDMKIELKAVHRGTQARSASYRVDEGMLSEGFSLLLPPQKRGEERIYDVSAEYYLDERLVVSESLGAQEVYINDDSQSGVSETKMGKVLVLSKLSKTRLKGKVTSSGGKGIQNAVVTLGASSTDKGGIKFSSTAIESSGVDGAFEIDVPVFYSENSLKYVFTVSFEGAEPYSSKEYVFERALPKHLSLVAENKKEVRGIVYGRDLSAVVPNARVIASPQREQMNKVESITNERGGFSLMLGSSEYAITVIPPADTKYPPGFYRVSSARDLDGTMAIVLGKSSLVFGRCYNPDGGPLVNAQVDIFTLSGESHEALSTAVTDEAGIYRAYVPQTDNFVMYKSL